VTVKTIIKNTNTLTSRSISVNLVGGRKDYREFFGSILQPNVDTKIMCDIKWLRS